MEDVDTISVAVSGIDINKVEPLDSRHIVAVFNQFLCTSVTFLNQFSTKCEGRLEQMQQKIFKLESQLKILECKLASIPPIPGVPSVNAQAVGVTNTNSNSSINQSQNENINSQTSHPDLVSAELPSSTITTTPVVINITSRDVDDESIPESEEGSRGTSCASSETGAGTVGEGESTNLKEDPRYSKYFKMAAVGVPIPAIKQKMMSEGVDPSILDT